MKLGTLLAQYLYLNKRLDLPGLGSFFLLSTDHPEGDSGKQVKHGLLQSVSFETNTSIKEVPELVQFISGQTGKIKALAAADLESYLELAQQFLNIGKPFSLEGIGTLEKNSAGEFSFIAGPHLPSQAKEQSIKDSSSLSAGEEPAPDYKSVFYTRKVKTKWKKPVAFLLLLVGLVLAIWGGYTVYKRTTARNNKAPVKPAKEETVPVQQPVVPVSTKTDTDTVIKTVQEAVTPPPPPPSGSYKFIIETAVRERALSRYARLKSFGLDIKMETTDSAHFKLFFLLPANTADTARMVDSLRGIYTPPGNRAYIEN